MAWFVIILIAISEHHFQTHPAFPATSHLLIIYDHICIYIYDGHNCVCTYDTIYMHINDIYMFGKQTCVYIYTYLRRVHIHICM